MPTGGGPSSGGGGAGGGGGGPIGRVIGGNPGMSMTLNSGGGGTSGGGGASGGGGGGENTGAGAIPLLVLMTTVDPGMVLPFGVVPATEPFER